MTRWPAESAVVPPEYRHVIPLYQIRKGSTGWVVHFSDQIDPLNMQSALSDLFAEISEDPPRGVRLCLDRVVNIQSSAAGRLVELKRSLDVLGIPLRITGLQRSVRDVLICMNLHRVLPIDQTENLPRKECSSSAPVSLATPNRPKVLQLLPGFGDRVAGTSNKIRRELEQHLESTDEPQIIFNFADIVSLDDADIRELMQFVERVEGCAGRCVAARMHTDLFLKFQHSGLAGRLMLYPEVGRARVALLAATVQR